MRLTRCLRWRTDRGLDEEICAMTLLTIGAASPHDWIRWRHCGKIDLDA